VIIPFFHIQNYGSAGWLVMLLGRPGVGSYLIHKERIEQNRLLLWAIFLSFPLPFIAILNRLGTQPMVGRQPLDSLRWFF